MDFLLDALTDWLKEMLVGGIMSNLSGMFDILLVIAFLISPYGLPMAAIWLLGKVQDLKFIIQDLVYG